MRRVELCILCSMVLIAMAAVPVSAATWHIYADGSGDAPTITAAVAAAAAGDSILVFAGTYYEHDIDVTKQLFIVGVAGEMSTIIDAQTLGRCFSVRQVYAHDCDQRVHPSERRLERMMPATPASAEPSCAEAARTCDMLDCTFRSNSANLGGAVMARDSSRCPFLEMQLLR